MPRWEQRFRAPRVDLPDWALDRPERCVLTSNESGTWEVCTWDASTGERRQVTDRPHGTTECAISPDGTTVWWFDDTDGDEFGVWRCEPFEGGQPRVPSPDVPAGYPAGLAIARDGTAAIGVSNDDGSSIWLVSPGGEATLLYSHDEDASVADLSADGSLVCLSHSEHGDSRHPALRVLRGDGSVVADLWDGPGRGLEALAFHPIDHRVLVGHERRGRAELLVWHPESGGTDELLLDLSGELDAQWRPDGTTLLVHRDERGRSDLHVYDLATGALEPVTTAPGVVDDATARPDGRTWLAWSSAAHPPTVIDDRGEEVVAAQGFRAPPSVPVTDVDVPTDHGVVHAFLAVPEAGTSPYPCAFVVHGGPEDHDSDSFRRDVAAYVDHGIAVVLVNYRGSTGYGSQWRDAIAGRVGRTELDDVAAVRAHLVAEGVIEPERTAITGGSWGGYLTLLALGTQPELWRCGVAAVPVADYLAAYEDEMEALKAFDRSLFGGSPEDKPEEYAAASPITYVEHVRAPVLVLAGANDPRCPLRQIESYLARLQELGKQHEVYRFDAGHGSYVLDERVRQMQAELDFVVRHLG